MVRLSSKVTHRFPPLSSKTSESDALFGGVPAKRCADCICTSLFRIIRKLWDGHGTPITALSLWLAGSMFLMVSSLGCARPASLTVEVGFDVTPKDGERRIRKHRKWSISSKKAIPSYSGPRTIRSVLFLRPARRRTQTPTPCSSRSVSKLSP